MTEISEEDQAHIASLKYFWREKRDITRYVHYEEIVDAYRKAHPEVINAWERFKQAETELDNIFSRLP